MSGCLLSWQNHVDKSFTGGGAVSEASDLRLSRLAEPQIRRRWRTNFGVTTTAIAFDFQFPKEIGVLALLQPDDAGGIGPDREALGFMAPTDQIRHWLDNNNPGAGILLDTGQVNGEWAPNYGMHTYVLPTVKTARFWSVGFLAPSISAFPGFIDLGRAWAGPAFRPGSNFVFGWGRNIEDGSTIQTNPNSGLEFVKIGPKKRVINFAFDNLTEEEAFQMDELQRIAGVSGQVLFIPAPGEAYQNKLAVIGRLSTVQPITQPGFERFSTVFQIKQSL